MMGSKNANSARASFQPIKKKLLASASAANGDGGTPATTPKKAATGKGKGKGKGKRARADSEIEDGGDDDDEEVLGVETKKAKTAEEDAVDVKTEGGETE